MTMGFLTGLTHVGAWLIWALLATSVAARAYTCVSRALRWLPTLHLPGPLQGLTAAVLGAGAQPSAPAPRGQPDSSLPQVQHDHRFRLFTLTAPSPLLRSWIFPTEVRTNTFVACAILFCVRARWP